MKIKEIIEQLELVAPSQLAYNWDNPGLLVGNRESETEKVLLALDVTKSVVDYAIETGSKLIVTHHPLFLNPVKRVTDPLVLKLIENRIAVYTMHTNLDQVKDGVSKALADKLGLIKPKFISHDSSVYHIALYVPPSDAEKVAEAVHQAGAGVIGNYSHCLNSYDVGGQFKPLPGSHPAIGEEGGLEKLQETKLEFFVDYPLLERVKRAIHTAHPYETPAYTVYQLQQNSPNFGLGVVGELEEVITLQEIAQKAKKVLHAPFVKLWLADESLDKPVRKVAVCGGSGSSLIEKVTGRADVFISADFTYHKVLESRIPLIDAGHFYTEYPVLKVIERALAPMSIETEIMDLRKAEAERLICL